LELADTGSRDHYQGVAQNLSDHPFVDRGLMFEFGNYEQNRWHLGQLDLAVLSDLGWTTANESKLSVVELPDSNPNLTGTSSANRIYGDHQNNILNGVDGDDSLFGNRGNDTIFGGSGNDLIYGNFGTDEIDGNSGNDTVYGGQGND